MSLYYAYVYHNTLLWGGRPESNSQYGLNGCSLENSFLLFHESVASELYGPIPFR